MGEAFINYTCRVCEDVVFRGTAGQVKALDEALLGFCIQCFDEINSGRITIPENKGVGSRHPATPRSERRYQGQEIN